MAVASVDDPVPAVAADQSEAAASEVAALDESVEPVSPVPAVGTDQLDEPAA